MSGILVATHGGASADGAVRVAGALADRLGQRLTIVAVVEPRPTVDVGIGVPYIGLPDAGEPEILSAVARQLARCGTTGITHLRRGTPAIEIDLAAQASGSDLIVVGLGPHRFLDRALGTETAPRLVQSACVPVLAVAPNARDVPTCILAAVDFSDTSIKTVKVLARWLREGDELVLGHVLPQHADAILSVQDATTSLTRLRAGLRVAAGVIVRDVILEGDPVDMLVHLGARMGADVIALGSHGYGLWKRLTLGSVAVRLLRDAPRSVLVTPRRSLEPWDEIEEGEVGQGWSQRLARGASGIA